MNNNIEEALSSIWELNERGIRSIEDVRSRLQNKLGTDLFDELRDKGYLRYEQENVFLTDAGKARARDLIRRQRLAERLFADVLEIGGQLMESVACEFEHIISPEIEKQICILLGHPKLCPHGCPIPEGACCRDKVEVMQSIVLTLDKLKPGERAKIVYMLTYAHPELHRLFSLGVTPGTEIKIHQTFPTFVIAVEEQQLALDKEIAKSIYVKKL